MAHTEMTYPEMGYIVIFYTEEKLMFTFIRIYKMNKWFKL